LQIHMIGPNGDIRDEIDNFRDTYQLKPGDWLLVRPDGYIGAVASARELEALEAYFASVGLNADARSMPCA